MSKPRRRHHLLVNPFDDTAFTRCPKCEGKTKVRKYPLVVDIECGKTLGVFNKSCRYCPSCDLVIVRKSELEPMLRSAAPGLSAKLSQDDYLIVGTLDRTDWQAGLKFDLSPQNVAERVWVFKSQWAFKQPGQTPPSDGGTNTA